MAQLISSAAKRRSRHRALVEAGGCLADSCENIDPICLKFLPKIHPKLSQNPSKSWPKWFKTEVWKESGGALRRVFAPRRLWAASWTPLGQLLGGSWRILGASWVAPGASWAPSWGVLGRLQGI